MLFGEPGATPSCRGQHETMLGRNGESREEKLAREAVAAALFCYRCPVELECLAHSLEEREPAGVWGGVGEEERQALIRDRRLLARAGA